MLVLNDIFKDIDELEDLRLDLILVEDVRPILFTCLDESKNIYLGLCSFANNERILWHITKTNYDVLIALLSDEITIYDAFKAGSKNKYMITYTELGVDCKKLTFDLLKEEYLPVKGEYMEVEDGEYDCELAEFKKRNSVKCYTATLNFYTETKTVLVRSMSHLKGLTESRWNFDKTSNHKEFRDYGRIKTSKI